MDFEVRRDAENRVAIKVSYRKSAQRVQYVPGQAINVGFTCPSPRSPLDCSLCPIGALDSLHTCFTAQTLLEAEAAEKKVTGRRVLVIELQ